VNSSNTARSGDRAGLFLRCLIQVALPFLISNVGVIAALDMPPVTKIADRDVTAWIAYLEGHDAPEAQLEAILSLGEFGPAAAPAVPALRKAALSAGDVRVRRLALESLGQIGQPAEAVVPELLALLKEEQTLPLIKRFTCEALARIAPKADPVRKAILQAVRSEEQGLHASAVDACVTLYFTSKTDRERDEALNALSRALRDGVEPAWAAGALRCLGSAGVPVLEEGVEKGRDPVKVAAANALVRAGAGPKTKDILLRAARTTADGPARAALIDALNDFGATDQRSAEIFGDALGDDIASPAAERALVKCGISAEPVANKALKSRKSAVKIAAANVLKGLGAAAAPSANALADALADKDLAVELAAAETLSAIGPGIADVAPKIQLVLRATKDYPTQRALLFAYGNVTRGPNDPPRKTPFDHLSDKEVIIVLSSHADPVARADAAAALRYRNANPDAPAAALLAALDDKNLTVRGAAARSLAYFGEAAKPASPKFAQWLASGEPVLYRGALAGLAGIGIGAHDEIPQLVAFVKTVDVEKDQDARKLMSLALRAQPESAVELAHALKDPDKAVRLRILHALESMGPSALPALQELLEVATASGDEVARDALFAVGAMGSTARDALPSLVKMLNLFEGEHRMAAAWAIAMTSPEFKPGEKDPHRVIEALRLGLLDADNEVVCRAAQTALVGIGPPVLPLLREILHTPEGELNYWTLRVMARLKADPDDVIPRLLRVAQPGNRNAERAGAAEMLGNYAPEHAELLNGLATALGDRDEGIRDATSKTFVLFGDKALPALEEVLHGRDPRSRRTAVQALETIRAKLKH